MTISLTPQNVNYYTDIKDPAQETAD